MQRFISRDLSLHPFQDDIDETVGCVILDCFERILLVKGGEFSSKLSFPKGSRKRGESILEGALREVWEETNLDLSNFEFPLTPKQFSRGKYFLVKLKWSFESFDLHGQANESGKVLWVYPEELYKYDRSTYNIDIEYFIKNMNSLLNILNK